MLDTRFDPMRHTRMYGEVVSIPKNLSATPMWQEPIGVPPYQDRPPFTWQLLNSIEQEVQVGDRIYYHFNTIPHNPIQFQRTRGNIIDVEGVHPNRTWFIKVKYDMILAVVRAGVIIPIGSYVLCDPLFETWDDIRHPTPVMLNGKIALNPDGSQMMKPKEDWLVTKVAPDHKYLRAVVRVVGSPLRGHKCEVKVGDRIWYKRNADWTVKIEGRDYFVIRQHHIIGREEEV